MNRNYRKYLNLKECVDVIKEYELKFPKPNIQDLAAKFNVTRPQISEVICAQATILLAYEKQCAAGNNINTHDAEAVYELGRAIDADSSVCMISVKKNQIKFLGQCMYEYLQRIVYHNIPIDDEEFLIKANEIKHCTALTKFRPSYIWTRGFMQKYGLTGLNLDVLRSEIQINEKKEKSLKADDLVRYVRDMANSSKTVGNGNNNSNSYKTNFNPLRTAAAVYEKKVKSKEKKLIMSIESANGNSNSNDDELMEYWPIDLPKEPEIIDVAHCNCKEDVKKLAASKGETHKCQRITNKIKSVPSEKLEIPSPHITEYEKSCSISEINLPTETKSAVYQSTKLDKTKEDPAFKIEHSPSQVYLPTCSKSTVPMEKGKYSLRTYGKSRKSPPINKAINKKPLDKIEFSPTEITECQLPYMEKRDIPANPFTSKQNKVIASEIIDINAGASKGHYTHQNSIEYSSDNTSDSIFLKKTDQTSMNNKTDLRIKKQGSLFSSENKCDTIMKIEIIENEMNFSERTSDNNANIEIENEPLLNSGDECDEEVEKTIVYDDIKDNVILDACGRVLTNSPYKDNNSSNEINTEPHVCGYDGEIETSHPKISTKDDNFPNVANNFKNISIKTEPSFIKFEKITVKEETSSDSIPLTESIDEFIPNHIVKFEEEFIEENHMEQEKQPSESDAKPLTHSNISVHNDIINSPKKLKLCLKEKLNKILNETNADECQQKIQQLENNQDMSSESPPLVIDNPFEAIKIVELLENYALSQENFKAVGLLTHLEESFMEQAQKIIK